MKSLLAYQLTLLILFFTTTVVGGVHRYQITGVPKARRVGISEVAKIGGALAMAGKRVTATGIAVNPDGPMPVLIVSHDEDSAVAFLSGLRAWSERFAEMYGDPSLRVVELSATRIRLANGMEARAFGDSPGKAGRSFAGLVIWDEACFSRDGATMFAGLRACADPTLGRPTGYPVWVVSTAWRADAFAWSLIAGDGGPGDPFAHIQRSEPLTLPRCVSDGFPYGAGVATAEEQAAHVERIRLETGDDAIFGAEMMCTPLSSQGAFVDSALLAGCQYDPPDLPTEFSVGIGIDIGRKRDATCIARALRDSAGVIWILPVEIHRNMPYAEQDARFSAVMAERPAIACIDATGLGGPSAEALARRAPGRVEQFVFGPTSKAELFEAFRHAMSTGRVRLCRQRELLTDFAALRREPRAGGTFAYEGSTGTTHCDLAVAAMLAFRAATRGARYDVDDWQIDRDPRFDDRPRSFRSMWDDDATPDIRGYRGTFF